jgi:iron complex outermembrane receptor protein
MKHAVRISLCASAMMAPWLLTTDAWGAQAETGPASMVDELVVTAQKRSETVQDIPAAITAVSGAVLQQRGVSQPEGLQFIVPSMQAGRLLGQTAITIRGVGLNQGSPGVAIHVGGVYQPRPSMGDLAQTDIARVEVLRGPQGTLYGRNANGGVVNFVTQDPTDRFEGYVLGSYASYDEGRLQGVLNVPVNERIRARLVLDSWRRDEGFVKNVLPGGQDVDRGRATSGRFKLAVDVTDDLALDLSATGLHSSGPTSYFTLSNKPSADAVAKNPYLATAIVPLQPRRISADDPIGADRSYAAAGAIITWKVAGLQVKSITGYQRLADQEQRDDDAINVNGLPVERWARSNTFTQEVNVAGSLGAVEVLVGAFYMRDTAYDKLHYNFPLGLSPLPAGSTLDFESFDYVTKSYAAFVDLTWHLTERAKLIGGLRYSEDRQSDVQRNFLTFGPAAPIDTCPLQRNEIQFHSTTPRVGAQYDVSDNSNLYATFSKGLKIGGFNPYDCNQVFKPEKVTSYEAGWKNKLLDGALLLNVGAFYYDYTDLQLNQVVGLVSKITNAAAARVVGAELESTWRPDPHWTLTGNLSLLKATYKDFVNLDTLTPALGAQDVSGNYLSNAPRVSANVGLTYDSEPIAFGGHVRTLLDVSYRSKIYFREFNTALDAQRAYVLLNASVIWFSADDKYQVRLFAQNLTNKNYIVRMSSSDGSVAKIGGSQR